MKKLFLALVIVGLVSVYGFAAETTTLDTTKNTVPTVKSETSVKPEQAKAVKNKMKKGKKKAVKSAETKAAETKAAAKTEATGATTVK